MKRTGNEKNKIFDYFINLFELSYEKRVNIYKIDEKYELDKNYDNIYSDCNDDYKDDNYKYNDYSDKT